ncbi:MAG: DMT family transporter [Actinomycetota bacterium]|nr:DMT family transporter [Actinomycetota bacterium]
MSRKGTVLFALMGAIWGFPYLLIKVSVRYLSPGTLVCARTGLAAIILLPIAARRGQLRPLLGHWRPIVVYTVVELAVPWLLLSDAERRLSSSLSGLLVAAVPLIGAILVIFVGGDDRLDRRRLAGLLVGLVGVGVLLGFDVSSGDIASAGEVAAVAVGYAVGPMIAARQLRDVPAMGVVTASLALTALAYLPWAAFHLPARVPPGRVLAAVAALAVVCTAVAFVAFFALIAEVGPTRATVITYINPAVAVTLGVAFLGESFGVSTAVGFALILGGSYLAVFAARRSEPANIQVAEP